MKVVIAPDSFKESMSAKEVCEAVEKGIRLVLPECCCYSVPMADGGEGTLTSMCDALDGTVEIIDSYDMFYQPRKMPLGICEDTVIIESASCIGLDMYPPEQRDIWRASTYGLGIAIKAALRYAPKKIILCLGGSATNDMGLGMLKALGVVFYNTNGESIHPLPCHMEDIVSLTIASLLPELANVEIVAACDVNNPLCGKQGASYIFGPQKGAMVTDVKKLDTQLHRLGTMLSTVLEKDILQVPGGGAAGGLGSTLYGVLRATLKPGVTIVKELVQLEKYMQEADVVITGEGSLDAQTLQGKTCHGVIESAQKYKVPVLVIAGNITPQARALYDLGATAYFPIGQQVTTIEEALQKGPQNITTTVENIFRWWQAMPSCSK